MPFLYTFRVKNLHVEVFSNVDELFLCMDVEKSEWANFLHVQFKNYQKDSNTALLLSL